MDEDPDDQTPAVLANQARLWWQHHTEEALRDLRLYPVQVETIGYTTDEPGEGW